MVKSYDVGSLPFFGDMERFSKGAEHFLSHPVDDLAKYFEETVVTSFIDKVEAGIDIPNYPQFRDMNKMFFQMIDGVERGKTGYVQTNVLSVKTEKTLVPEVMALKKNSQEIYERIGKPFEAKFCVTGPYTLSSLLTYRTGETFTSFGNLISQIIENNIFSEKCGRISLVTVDEPTFGLLDDSLVGYGSDGREHLRKAWESIFQKAVSKGAQTCLHLHSTADKLFWEIESLNIIESHVGDPLYQMKKNKEHLESTDKFLKASICITNFDKLIRENVTSACQQKLDELIVNQRVAETWKNILNKKLKPETFVENAELMKKRLIKIVNQFGAERVPYAGPECGLKGFPTYECALECLRRVSKAVKNFSL
jgi:5-methyltetrahydropteroyltriglutamate--homocysteine methyltransferase